MEFKNRLNKAITYSGLTAAELARKSGLSPSEIARYRKGEYEPKLQKLYALAVALNVSPSWLMGYDLEENEGPLDTALASLWSQLTDSQKEQVIDYMRFVASHQTERT